MRWSTRIVLWEPLRLGYRHAGRPVTRWEDSLNKFASSQGFKWTELARDREQWKMQEGEFIKVQVQAG